jgi:hypothetical protein
MTGFGFQGGGTDGSTRSSSRQHSASDSSGGSADFEMIPPFGSEVADGSPRTGKSSKSGSSGGGGATIIRPQFTDGVASVDGSGFSLSKVWNWNWKWNWVCVGVGVCGGCVSFLVIYNEECFHFVAFFPYSGGRLDRHSPWPALSDCRA